jgi:hypothetical protein
MLSRIVPVLAAATAAVSSLMAQTTPASSSTPTRLVLTTEQQIAAAVLPAPKEFRDSATVLGYGTDGKLQELRRGTGSLVCLAPDPARERFQVACYHRALEPFMARGRELRSQGVTGDRVDSARFAEVRSGRLAFPTHPALLYSLNGAPGSYDPATNAVKDGRPLFVVYVKDATAASTGLPAQPVAGLPWIMHPGTIKAHIMFSPTM